MENIIENKFLEYVGYGLSCMPVYLESKKPLIPWKSFQKKVATKEKLSRWYLGEGVGIAILCGGVSGNLEVIDIDSYKYPDNDIGKLFRNTFI